MIKLSLIQKFVAGGMLVVAIALSCQKNDSEEVVKTEGEKITSVETSMSEKGEVQLFVPYDTPPQPIVGFDAIQKNLKYPELARKAGIEGKVVVQLCIDDNGKPKDIKILESVGSGCDEAAIDALKSVEWEPAKDKGKPVAVWVTVPVVFKLR